MGDADRPRTALWVVAHPQPDSLNAHLRDVGTHALRDRGWGVVESDLYAMGWDPVSALDLSASEVSAIDRDLVARLAGVAEEDPIPYLPLSDDHYDHESQAAPRGVPRSDGQRGAPADRLNCVTASRPARSAAAAA